MPEVGRGQLELRLLGPPDARRGAHRLHVRTRKAFALLAYLVAEGGAHRRAELAALLWPDSDDHRARTTLRSALADLRSVLGSPEGRDDGYLRVDRDSLRFDADLGAGLDLTFLGTAYERARGTAVTAGLEGEQRSELAAQLRAGATAYTGEFLEGFYLDDAPDFDYWASLERERWRTRLTVVLDRLSGLLLESGEALEAMHVAERWAAEDPLSGAANERLMRATYALGDRAGALQVYERHRAAVAAEPGGRMAPAMMALAERIAATSGPGGTLSRSPRENRPEEAARRGPQGALRTPLVGRSREFEALVTDYYATLDGGPRFVTIRGEAGIGKTRLVEEFLRWAVGEGADVLRAPAFEATEGLPYGPLVVALRDRMERERAPDDLLDDVWLAELSRLLPELTSRYPDLPPPSNDEASSKTRLFEAVATLVTGLAARRPVVMFFDDLQWTDAATFDLMRYATRRWADDGAPVLLTMAGRLDTPETRARLAGQRASLSKDLPVRRELLGPLTRRDTARLVRETVTPGGEEDQAQAVRLDRFGEWLHDETGGQPFFLTEALAALIERGVVVPGGPSGGGWLVETEAASVGTTPPGVRVAILARLRRLSPDASMLLAAAAVVGRHCDFEILRRMVGTDEDTGLAALDEALTSGLLVEVSDDVYACAHDKIRDVVYTEAGGARRRIYHRRALEALEGEGAPAAELARHALAARAVGAAFHHSVAAAEEALAVFAVEDAQAHFLRARELLEHEVTAGEVGRLGALEERLGLYGGLGQIFEVTRAWDEAQDAYERMLAEARSAGDREAEWVTLHRLAALGIDEGNVAVAERGGELSREVRRARAGRSVDGERAGGYGPDAGAPAAFAYSLAQARLREAEALSLAREMGRADLVAESLTAVGVLEAHAGRWAQALAAAEEGIEVCAETGDRALAGELLSLAARSLTMRGEPRAAVRRMRDHPGLTGALGDREVHRADVFSMALALTETGDYEEALAVAQVGVTAARAVGYAPRLMLNLLTLGDTSRVLFRLGEAAEVYREMADVVFPPEYCSLVHAKLSAVAAIEANWDKAHAEALLAAQQRVEAPIQSTEALHRHLEVEALLRGGSRSVAIEQLSRFGEAVGNNQRLSLAYGRAAAVLRRYAGDHAGASQQLHQAWELADKLQLPGERWQIDATLAEVTDEQGDRSEAARLRSRAAEGVRGLATRIQDRQLRQDLLSATPVQRVLQGVAASR